MKNSSRILCLKENIVYVPTLNILFKDFLTLTHFVNMRVLLEYPMTDDDINDTKKKQKYFSIVDSSGVGVSTSRLNIFYVHASCTCPHITICIHLNFIMKQLLRTSYSNISKGFFYKKAESSESLIMVW